MEWACGECVQLLCKYTIHGVWFFLYTVCIVPFEENDSDPSVWFLDHNYHENMAELFKKVSAKERPVGWYHTGGKLRSSDLRINDLFLKYCSSPVLVVIDPTSSGADLPFNAYFAVEEIKEDGTSSARTFAHINSLIESEEAEEIGVEHLLRDVKDEVLTGVSGKVANKLDSLCSLERQLDQIEVYLGKVIAGELSINHQINYALQDIFNLLPNVHCKEATSALTVSANDQLSMVYVGSLTRAVLAMHELIDNKLDIAQQAQQQMEKS